jgi:hypothetical protein
MATRAREPGWNRRNQWTARYITWHRDKYYCLRGWWRETDQQYSVPLFLQLLIDRLSSAYALSSTRPDLSLSHSHSSTTSLFLPLSGLNFTAFSPDFCRFVKWCCSRLQENPSDTLLKTNNEAERHTSCYKMKLANLLMEAEKWPSLHCWRVACNWLRVDARFNIFSI